MHTQFLDKYDKVIQTTLKNDDIPFFTISQIIGDDYKEDLERVKMGTLNILNIESRVGIRTQMP